MQRKVKSKAKSAANGTRTAVKNRVAKPRPKQAFDNDHLGRITQQKVGTLAEEAFLNPSQSNPDLEGWDFHFTVQRNEPMDETNFPESQRPRTAMFVQVKGTTGKLRHQSIALKHWQHVATMSSPFFFLVVEYDAPPIPARLFVVPVDQAIVVAVTKRLRQESVKARKSPRKLHRLTMNLRWNASHEVPWDPACLRAALLKHTGENMDEYSAKKRQWREEAGHDTLRTHVTLKFPGTPDQVDQILAEWALGIADSVAIEEYRRTEYRWDIPQTFEPMRDGLLSFGAPPSLGKTRVRISNATSSEHAEFDADIFCNFHFLPQLPKNTWAVRLACEFLEMRFRPDDVFAAVRFRISPNQPPIVLAHLATIARAVRLLAGPCQISYSVPTSINNKRFTAKFGGYGDVPVREGEVNANNLLLGAEAAFALSSLFGMPPDFSISIAELEARSAALQQSHTLNTSNKVVAEIPIQSGDEFQAGERVSFLHFHLAKLGNFDLIGAAVVEGPVVLTDDGLKTSGPIKFIERWVVDRADRREWEKDVFPGLASALLYNLEASGNVRLVADTEVTEAINKLRESET